MKKAYPLLAIALLVVFGSCMNESRFLVEYDYSYKGNFKKYNSFCFVDNGSADDKDSTMSNPIIEESVRKQLELHGYRFNKRKPSLLVSYKIFYDDLRFQGFNQPEIENWIATEDEEVKYDPIKYSMVRGTLVVQLLDAKKHQTVWQGYASGLYNDQTLTSDRYLKRAVRSIFDKYRLFADGYILENRENAPVGNSDK
ncbi:DUF4136 domain-containing protein [Cytophagaceae bacterium DM2B3-1]|uniref:DUF4136 domain-containing protein n=2 Tax=Xanthocytophaga TaxID=3078918 RepID=A0AAE3QMX9_9BACT|nr:MULTISPECIES: DUF4136 domain-containing protein [Xanthocytophaga]MDJ1470598.1 DUF4136 domain-containing protein [Xanthocytophaga flavus]MDJ1481596.1 DUF4136 domain-containing protein [Xanthocytophaga flavus]MDJ1491559.1 DUF4136 domain-containing protein [Xanthocytophaga flavus]MDJ1502518.1 DUF4136 domain-containing protein [Xanthocytophaga agilis]